MAFNISGLSSGLDTENIISKMLEVEKIPLQRLESDQAKYNDKIPLYNEVNGKLLDLKLTMNDLMYETPFASKAVSTSNSSLLSGVVTDLNATNGTYIIDSISKIATATVATSTKVAGGFVDTSKLISETVQKNVIGGTFTINGATFVVDPTKDSMDKILNNINAAAGSTGVIASYDYTNDKVVLQNLNAGNKNTILIGNPLADTSNFLTAIGLNGAFQDISSGTTVVNSSSHLGALNISKKLIDSRFDKDVVAGNIKINGVSINIDTSDEIVNIINDINNSAAGVTLNYDASLDKFQFISKSTGTSNIKFEEVAGGSNFLELIGVIGAKSSNPISASLSTGDQLTNLKLTTPFAGNAVLDITGASGTATVSFNGANTIGDVISAVNAQIGTTGVFAEYDAMHGRIKFKAADQFYTTPISVAYGGGNTSNFLDAFNLTGATSATEDYGYSVLESSADVGMIKLTDTLGAANFKNAIPAAGMLTVKQGPFTYNVAYDTSMTVQDLMDAITTTSGGTVKAKFDTESGKVVLKADPNGDPNITVSDSEAGPNLMTALGLSGTNEFQRLGENAEYKLNGVTYFSNSNTIADKITSVSFTLQAKTDNPVSLTVKGDASEAKKLIEDMVKKYNEIAEQLNKEVNDEEGPLYRDTTFNDVIDSMRKEINRFVDNGLTSTAKSFPDIGLSTGKVGMIFTKDYIGKIEIDSKKLEAALNNNPMDVRKLFAYDENNGNDYTDGIAFYMNKYLDSLTSLDGIINSVVKLNQRQLSDVKADIVHWNDRIKLLEDGLRTKFNSMETLMNQLKAQSTSLQQSLSQLSSGS